jgi:methylphosphotriester-DNA--protein-cysteine methyltransferase
MDAPPKCFRVLLLYSSQQWLLGSYGKATNNRYFHRVVGTSPKHYFSVLRARTTLSAFVANREDFVPFEYGYYDRSHFDKDIRKFTGHQPTSLIFKG